MEEFKQITSMWSQVLTASARGARRTGKGVTDRRLREVVEECVELPGYECLKRQVPRWGGRGEGRRVQGP